MLNPEKTEWDRFRDLTEIMEKAPRQESPEGFAARVMARLPEHDAGLLFKLKRALTAQAGDGFNFGWGREAGAVSKMECPFYFFLTGCFYLIMGFILMVWFRAIGSNVSTMGWLGLQPHLTLGTAILLLALGLFFLIDGKIAISMARYGTLLYVFSVVMNGIFIRPYFYAPYANVFIIVLTVGGVCMGILLALAVHKMELRID